MVGAGGLHVATVCTLGIQWRRGCTTALDGSRMVKCGVILHTFLLVLRKHGSGQRARGDTHQRLGAETPRHLQCLRQQKRCSQKERAGKDVVGDAVLFGAPARVVAI